MTRPNLEDPEERAAYKRELKAVARMQRALGFGFIGLGALMVLSRSAGWAVWATGEGPDVLALGVLAAGWVFLVWAFLKRNAHHRRRMSES